MPEYIFEKVQDNEERTEYIMRQELIKCKDCKWWDKKPLTITRRCSIFNTDTDMTFFCKHGRRENE